MTGSNERQPIGKVIRNFFLFGLLTGFPFFILGIILAFIGPFILLGPDSAFEVSRAFSLPFGGVCGGAAGFSAGIIAGIMTITAKPDEKFKFGWVFAIWFLLTIWFTCGLGAVIISTLDIGSG